MECNELAQEIPRAFIALLDSSMVLSLLLILSGWLVGALPAFIDKWVEGRRLDAMHRYDQSESSDKS